MAAISDDRRRLADLTERRRAELGLRWKEVAEAGGISYEAIRAVRNGDAEIRALTKHGIDTGLRWEPGSVQAILDGGDPRPAAEPAPASRLALAAVPDSPGADVFDLAERMLVGDLEQKIWAVESVSKEDRLKVILALRKLEEGLTAELDGSQGESHGGLASV